MKKIVALFLTFISLTLNASFAFSELYYVKNISEDTANSIIRTNLDAQNYSIINEKPYYAIYSRNNGEYVVSIAQQSGTNLFYYYMSNNNKKINNAILKTFKNYGSNYEQSYNTTTLNVYDNLAQKLISGGKNQIYNKYSFDENNAYSNNYNATPYNNTTTGVGKYNNTNHTTQNIITTKNNGNFVITANPNNYYNNTQYSNRSNVYVKPTTAQQTTLLKGAVISVETGTKIKTYLQNPINTSSAQKGDRIIAVLTDDLRYNGVTVAPQGSLVYGSLTKARPATYGSRNGRVVIEFTQLVTPENKVYEISTDKIDFTVTNDGKLSRTVGNAVAGAAIGALAGLLFGAISDRNLLAATAIGAGVGAGTSLVGSGAERGVDAEIPSFTELELVLTKPFKATVNY